MTIFEMKRASYDKNEYNVLHRNRYAKYFFIKSFQKKVVFFEEINKNCCFGAVWSFLGRGGGEEGILRQKLIKLFISEIKYWIFFYYPIFFQKNNIFWENRKNLFWESTSIFKKKEASDDKNEYDFFKDELASEYGFKMFFFFEKERLYSYFETKGKTQSFLFGGGHILRTSGSMESMLFKKDRVYFCVDRHYSWKFRKNRFEIVICIVRSSTYIHISIGFHKQGPLKPKPYQSSLTLFYSWGLK